MVAKLVAWAWALKAISRRWCGAVSPPWRGGGEATQCRRCGGGAGVWRNGGGGRVPHLLATLLQPVADANSFCSVFMVGMLMDLPRTGKDVGSVLRVLGWRLPLGVLFAAACWFLLPFDASVRKTAVMLLLLRMSVMVWNHLSPQLDMAMKFVFGRTFVCDDDRDAREVTFNKSVDRRDR